MVSISCNQKREEIQTRQLDDILYHLQQCGVIIYLAVHERHGKYNQWHTHAICQYSGKYKNHTKYGNRSVEGFDFKIHWTPITDYNGCMTYLEKTPNCIIARDL